MCIHTYDAADKISFVGTAPVDSTLVCLNGTLAVRTLYDWANHLNNIMSFFYLKIFMSIFADTDL